MNNKQNAENFLNTLIEEISRKDKLHSKKILTNISFIKGNYPIQLEELIGLVNDYFKIMNLSAERVADDYLKMVKDMRMEGLYFYKHGKYRCENQNIANEYVYSKPDVMTYYMNALLVSQVMWKHHFNIFMYFQSHLRSFFKTILKPSILDIGPGHGFFSYLIKKEFPSYQKIDIVDISDTSLQMTKNIIGEEGGKINYYKKDIFEYEDSNKYDFIVLGEVIEHLDDPKSILQKLSRLLKPNGILWLTTPTNSPALDHVYLFNTKEEVFTLVEDVGLNIVNSCNFFAEDVEEKVELKNKITNLIGLFCKNS